MKSVLASETLLFEFNILATLVIGSMTRCSWKQLGMAWDMGAGSPTGMRVYWTGERARLKMADLPQMHRMLRWQALHAHQGVVPYGQCTFDYLGLVVGVGPVQYSGEYV